MSNIIVINILRFIAFFLVQLLILKRLSYGWEGFMYVNVLLYPLFILLLPFRTPKPLVVFLGFLIGFFVDLGYGTLGVHSGAMVATAYFRSFVINWLEPREGYNIGSSPNKEDMGGGWFIRYTAILMFTHIFIYFCIDAFTPVYIVGIVGKTFWTFLFSMLLLLVVVYTLNPKK